MHPMIMLTSDSEGLVYANGTYLGEVRKEAPIFRPVSPYGAVNLEFRPFHPMALPVSIKIVFSNGKPLSQSFPGESGATVTSWPFGITEIRLPINIIHTGAPFIKTLTGAGRTFKYIKTPAGAYLETEFQGRMSVHPLPKYADEPVFAEGDGVLYVSGSARTDLRYALILTQTGEHMLISLLGKDISFLPGGRIRLIKETGDLAGHETEEIYLKNDAVFQMESSRIQKSPDKEFRAVTPFECAVCAAESILYSLEDELSEYFAPEFSMDEQTNALIRSAASIRPLLFTPPDGRSAVAALSKSAPAFFEAAPLYYRAEMTNGVWKIIDMKAW